MEKGGEVCGRKGLSTLVPEFLAAIIFRDYVVRRKERKMPGGG
jgi:hypothetical protein